MATLLAPLNTLGRRRERRFTMTAHCLPCAMLYRKEAGPKSPHSFFDVDLPTLIAERGADYPFATGSFEPIPCAYCGSRRTEIRMHPPPWRPI